MVPSERCTVPTTDLSTPVSSKVAPLGTSSGGHFTAQSPSQLDFGAGLATSLSNRYSVIPSRLVTMGPSGLTFITTRATDFAAAAAAPAFLPAGVVANHLPPTPCPNTSPALVSLA